MAHPIGTLPCELLISVAGGDPIAIGAGNLPVHGSPIEGSRAVLSIEPRDFAVVLRAAADAIESTDGVAAPS